MIDKQEHSLYDYFEFVWKIFAWCFGIIGVATFIGYCEEGSIKYWLAILLCYFLFIGGIIVLTDIPKIIRMIYQKIFRGDK